MLFLCLSVLLSVRCLGIGAETVDVKTSSGTVRGQTITELGKELNQFYGIPFAEPPVDIGSTIHSVGLRFGDMVSADM